MSRGSKEDADQFDRTYGRFADSIYAAIRSEAFGEDIGQNSWITAEELRRFCGWLELTSTSELLDVASGTGGPDLFIVRSTGCRVTGVDIHEAGVAVAVANSRSAGLAERTRFVHADARQPLPFRDGQFDAILSIDAMNHFYDRAGLLQEFRRLLRPGGRLLFTNAVTLTGLLRKEEMVERSYGMGEFVFTPMGYDQKNVVAAGFELLRVEDLTDTVARVARAWHEARAKRTAELDRIEGVDQNAAMQRFLDSVSTLALERRLSRPAYLARRNRV